MVLEEMNCFVFAGFYGGNELNSIEKYSLLGDKQWHVLTIQNPFTPRSSLGSAVIGANKVLILGGTNKSDSFILNTDTNNMVQIADAPVRIRFVCMPSTVYDIGRQTVYVYTDYPSKILELDLTTKQWTNKGTWRV